MPSAIVTPGCFRVFRAEPVPGRSFTEQEDLPDGPDVAVVSWRLWQERLGGRTDVPGSMLEIEAQRYIIVGVAPRGFDFPDGARLWTPMRNDDEHCGRGCTYAQAVARLGPGTTLATAREQLDGLARRLEANPKNATDIELRATTLRYRSWEMCRPRCTR